MANTSSKNGLGALLTPDTCAVILIDHQAFQFAGMKSHDPQTIINNVVGLAKTAKLFKVPTLLTTVTEERGDTSSSSSKTCSPSRSPSIAPSSTRGRTTGS